MDMEGESINLVTCMAWVPKGAAKQIPDKLELTKEELTKLLQMCKSDTEKGEVTNITEEHYDELEKKTLENETGVKSKKKKKSKAKAKAETKTSEAMEEEAVDEKDPLSGFNEKNDISDLLSRIEELAVHCDNKGKDPLMEERQDQDDKDDAEDFQIRPDDNLVAVGRVEEDISTLEIYVYNEKGEGEGCMYVHHDIFLPELPICFEWLDYNPYAQTNQTCNLLAIGYMDPVIDIWNLDLVDALDPTFKLGTKKKKKKRISALTHTDAVLCLAWNKELHHLLASGSADDSVIIWDIEEGESKGGKQQYTEFSKWVQGLKWHPTDAHCLLTGACDKHVRLIDCRTSDVVKCWKLDGEVEDIAWQKGMEGDFKCLACTDQGSLYCFDRRHKKPLWRVKAHESTVTGIAVSELCPGCVVCVSDDQHLSVWDTHTINTPECVQRIHPHMGILHTIAASPQHPFVFSIGGDNKQNNFKVWDLRNSKKVRKAFCERINLPVDSDGIDWAQVEEEEENEDNEDEEELMDYEGDEINEEKMEVIKGKGLKKESSENSKVMKWKSKPKTKKLKGGHLDRRKR